jgi:hypothetical protein
LLNASAEGILNALEKRRVRRRQRPLLVYGLAAPLAVILLMALAGLGMFKPVIQSSQGSLQTQVLEGDQVMAQLLANGMETGLANRIKYLKALLEGDSSEKLKGLIAKETSQRAAGADLTDVRKQVNLWLESASKETTSSVGRSFSGLLAADANGFIIANGLWEVNKAPWHVPPNHEAFLTEDKSWRDWFNGRGNQTKGGHYAPVSAPHISQPFVSKEKDQGRDRGIVLCVSVPVEGADGNVIGVLTGSLTWKEFGRWNEDVAIAHGKIVVFNQRGEALKHKSRGPDGVEQDDVVAFVKQAGDGNPHAYPDELAAQLKPEGAEMGVCEAFDDPFQGDKGGRRLAGYKFFIPNNEDDSKGPLGAKWGVIVEHDKGKVLAPVDQLSQFMYHRGLWMLVGAGVLTAGVWVGLIWLLRRDERLGHG